MKKKGRHHKKLIKEKMKRTGILPHSLYKEINIEILENPIKHEKSN